MPAAGAPVRPSFRVGIALLVSILLLVPALVRAMEPLRASKPSPVRLSRGFELPPAKCHVTPPTAVAVPVASTVEPSSARVSCLAGDIDEGTAGSPSDDTPDPQRGPPQTSRA